MVSEEENQSTEQTTEQPVGGEVEGVGETQAQGDDSQTTKNVLAAILGIVVVALIIWLFTAM